MKGLYCCILFFASITICSGQVAGAFRSFQTGDWNNVNTWERFDGAVWVNPAPSTPTNADGAISVQSGHTVTITANVTIDQTTIQTGGAVIVNNAVTLTLANGPGSGTDLIISSGAVLTINGTTGALTVNNGILGNFCGASVSGTINNAGNINFVGSTSRLTFNANSVYDHQHTTTAGGIPRGSTTSVVTWNATSTCQITGYTTNTTAPTGLDQAFGNFIWNTINLNAGGSTLDLNGQLDDINGNLTIQSMGVGGDVLYFSIATAYTLNVDGNLTINDGIIAFANDPGANLTLNLLGDFTVNGGAPYMSGDAANVIMNLSGDFNILGGDFEFMLGTGAATVNVAGNVSFNGNTITSSGGTTNIVFGGAATHQFINTITTTQNINFTVENGSTLNLNAASYLMGNGTFTLQAGAILGVASTDGLVTGTNAGNIRLSGTRTYTANSNIIYNGTSAQNLGNEWGSSGALNGIAVNLEIANTNTSGVTNNVIGSTSVVGNLTLTSNPLHIGNSNTLVIQSNFTATGGTIGGLSTSNLTFSGSGTITGNLNFAAGSQNLNNLTISRDATISLGTSLTISGTLSFTEAGELRFNGQTLTVNGNITQTGGGASGGLESNNTSNLIIGGTGPLSALPFVNSSQLNNLTFGRTSGGTYTLSSALIINGTLALNAGTLTHSSGLTMANSSTFSRNAGATITNNAPNTTGSYNVSYAGTLTTGLELPSSPTALNSLTVAGDATLDKAITINGDLNVNSGTFNASTFNLTMAGANFLVNGGAFTIAGSSTVTFSRAGTTILGGLSIGGTQFGNLTINSGATLSAPNANINVQTTWENLGSFTANSGTVTFNGANQNIDPNGQPFNHVTFAGIGTKTLQGALDVNGTLTISSALDVGANQPVNVAGAWTNNGTFTAAGGTVTFDGTAQTINANGQPFFNLTLANSGTKTLANPIDINGALVINNGVTFDVSATAYAVNVAGNWTNNGSFNGRTGTVTFDGTTAIAGGSATNFFSVTIAGALTASTGTSNVSGNWLYSSGSFASNGGTIQFNGATQSITSGGQAFSHVVIGGTNTKTIQDNIDINGSLTLNASAATFSVGSNRTVNLAGNFDASGGGILAAQSGLFIFDGGAQSITSGGEVFFNTEFSGTSTKTLVDALDVNGYVDINSTLAAGANTINVAGNWDDTGTFTSNGTTIFDGAAQNIRSTGSAFDILTLAGSGTKTLQDALDVDNHLTITSTLDVSASNFLVAVGGNWNSSAGTFVSRAGEVRLNGGLQDITSGAANNFFDLTVSGTDIKTLQDALDINGELIINTGLNVGSNNTIEIAGQWTNNSGLGAASFSAGTGTVIFDGNGTTNVRGTGSTQFYSMNVTGSTNVEIESTHSLRGTLTLVGVSSQFNAVGTSLAGIFTLVSSDDDPTVDGRIAALPVPANFTGNVTVQRFMSQESMPSQSNTRLYRYISSPVSGAPVSQIQSEIPVTGSFTGSSSCSGCTTSQSMFAYDESIGTTYDDGWIDFPADANTETLQQGTGYALYVRGNIISSALWDVRGPVFSGNINLPVTYNNVGTPGADGFNLVGNPYPSAIDWDLIHPSSTNIANAVYIRDNPNGIYTQYVGGVGANGGTKDIAMGQAFWVEATGASPVLPLTESAKSASSTTFFRTAPFSDLLRITLGQSNLRDEIVIRFHNEATDLFDAAYDARKFQNTIFNLSSVLTDNNKLSINTLGSVDCGREIKLDVSDVATGRYELSLAGVESFNDQVSIQLIDNYLNQTLDARTTSIYGFNVDSNIPETFGGERFKMIFEFNGSIVQPEILTSDVCQGSDASIQILNSNNDVHYTIYSNGNLISDIGAGNGANLTVTIPKDQLTAGDNIFELKAVNSYCNQISLNQDFTITNEILPQISSTKGSSNCLSGAVGLTATGADEGDFRWYESIDDTAPIAGATGSEFTTPELSKTKTYYVAAVNNLGCEGPRVEVVAQIISYDPVTLSETNSGQLVSSYTEGNQWYKDGELIQGATGKIYTPTESGTYTVEIKIGDCITSAQQMFLVTGNEEAFSNGKLNVYPNPVKGELIIESRFEQNQPPVIFDPTGKVIGTIVMNSSQKGWIGTYDFSGMTKGVYILKVTEKGVPKFKRIVKE
ncbi:MAG: T9SS type A sorting domain-containing protein [Cyclobacteriaceae bacterium]